MSKLTAERVRELLDYDPVTGVFTWKPRRLSEFPSGRICKSWNAQYAGTIAGCPKDGYIQVSINDQRYRAHRLAWLWSKGRWPPKSKYLDHRNGIRNDNKIANLRPATPSQSAKNTTTYSDHRGLYKNGSGWAARIHTNGRCIYLGTFRTRETAQSVYEAARKKYHGEWARAAA